MCGRIIIVKKKRRMAIRHPTEISQYTKSDIIMKLMKKGKYFSVFPLATEIVQLLPTPCGGCRSNLVLPTPFKIKTLG